MVSSILKKAGGAALRGGLAGAISMVLNVVLLMWLRTTVNYQYRYGGTMWEAMEALYASGGILRFYQGAQYALLSGPLSRFGDTAANEGVQELLASWTSVGLVTAVASFAAACWRIALTPLDTIKTTLQVNGREGLSQLGEKIKKFGVLTILYDGALGNWVSNIVGHYPWFVVNNYLETVLPKPSLPANKLIRRAFIGFVASVTSDCFSNGIRVVKTFKQTSDVPITYAQAITRVVESSGIAGLLFRGLGTKIISNALSSILFSVLWKMLMDQFKRKENDSEGDKTE